MKWILRNKIKITILIIVIKIFMWTPDQLTTQNYLGLKFHMRPHFTKGFTITSDRCILLYHLKNS